jgi:hypothetical protein
MERNSPGALLVRKPGAFGASGTSDSHAIISSCSLHVTRVCSLAAVLRPPAAPAPPAPLPLFSSLMACKFVARRGPFCCKLCASARSQRLCGLRCCGLRCCGLRCCAVPLAAPPAPLSAAFGRTAVLLNPAWPATTPLPRGIPPNGRGLVNLILFKNGP